MEKNFFLFIGIIILLVSCEKKEENKELPDLYTLEVNDITLSSAVSGGTITDDGNDVITERGVCWSTNTNPTLDDESTNDGDGIGTYTSYISGLEEGTIYFVRAYATNGKGTAYGNELTFKTLETLKDISGNEYGIIQIGNQTWMAENLKTSKFNDGTIIPMVTGDTEWSNLTSPAYCLYNNDTSYRNTYGALYNWNTVNTGKLCPTGWHVPTDGEWTTLTSYLGNNSGSKLKETGTKHWNSSNSDATNESGFTALPGGYRHNEGGFFYVGDDAYWWSSTETDVDKAVDRNITLGLSSVYRGSSNKRSGLSVRCIKN